MRAKRVISGSRPNASDEAHAHRFTMMGIAIHPANAMSALA
jgi:hypothetical protein